MEKRKIKDLKRGDYFTLLLQLKSPTFLRYGLEENTFLRLNAYSTYKWENINHEVIQRGDKEVYTDFTF